MSVLAGSVASVVKGRNDRLFLGRQDGFDLGRFTNGTDLTTSQLVQWRSTLRRRGREMAARKIPYVFMLAPDAPSVYPEDLPDEYPAPHDMSGAVFMAAMGHIPGVIFVDPSAALRSAKGGLDVYQRNDSHWSDFGAGVAYRELMRVIGPLVESRVVASGDVSFTHKMSFGDLGSMSDPEVRAQVPIASIDGPEPDTVMNRRGADRQTGVHTRMVLAGKGRVIAFRDSFMSSMVPYLARSVGELATFGTTTRLMLDAVDAFSPGLVMSEVAERRLGAFETDHHPHAHDWIYGCDYGSEAGLKVLAALNMMATNPREAADIIRRAPHEISDDPLLGYSAALVLDGADDLEGALRFIDPIVGDHPGAASALWLAGRIRIRAGRAAESVPLLRCAVAAAPWNGAYHELLTYALIRDHRPAEASEVAEYALRSIDDFANLWYWAGILREALNRREDAHEAALKAVTLQPWDMTYRALAERASGVDYS